MFNARLIVLDNNCANKLKTGRKYVAVRSSKPLIHSYYYATKYYVKELARPFGKYNPS